jgi:hypothetical protein
MKLIIEEAESVKYITEEINGKKALCIEGNFLMANEPNRNNRVYPMKILRDAVNTYTKNFIESKRSLGELNHNSIPGVDLTKVSHMITSLKENGNYFYGKARILNTPMGKIAQGLIDEGVVLGVSSRALGSVKQTNEGYSVVGPDLVINCVDIVHDPSVGAAAFVNGIYEGKEWIYDSAKQEYVAMNIKNKIERDVVSKRLSEERMIMHFENYLNML